MIARSPKKVRHRTSEDPTRDETPALVFFEPAAVVVALEEPEEVEDELPDSLARARKFSKLLGPDSTALIAKTIPAAQCPV